MNTIVSLSLIALSSAVLIVGDWESLFLSFCFHSSSVDDDDVCLFPCSLFDHVVSLKCDVGSDKRG